MDLLVTDLNQSGNISIHIIRSWANKELYVLAVKPKDSGSSVKIKAITWEQNNGRIYTSEK